MLADWRELSSKILESFDKTNLDNAERAVMRDLLISRRRLHLDPEPRWASLTEIPLVRGGVYDSRSGRIQISLRDKLREIVTFSKYLLALLANLLSSNHTKGHRSDSLNLFFSDGFSNFSRPLFHEFLQERRFQSILEESVLIVQDRNIWRKKKIESSIFVKDIGLYLFTFLLNRRERMSLILEICRILLSSRRFKDFVHIGKTKLVIEKTLWVKLLAKNSGTNLLATNSFMEILPTPFYILPSAPGKRYLLWYSNNNFPAPSQDGIEMPDNRIDFACRSEVDVHLVWTSDFADSIRNRNRVVEIQVIGSLMMYPKRAIEPLEGFFNIVLFDMTPWEGYPSMMFGSELFMRSFIEDIQEVSLEFPATRIYLKPKRKFVRNGGRYNHSSSYLALIDACIAEGLLNLLDPTTNLYGLCERADLILGFPFASPAIIGHEQSRPSFYYNPEFSKDWKIRQSMDNVSVISGKENLRQKIQEIYNSKNSRFNQS